MSSRSVPVSLKLNFKKVETSFTSYLPGTYTDYHLFTKDSSVSFDVEGVIINGKRLTRTSDINAVDTDNFYQASSTKTDRASLIFFSDDINNDEIYIVYREYFSNVPKRDTSPFVIDYRPLLASFPSIKEEIKKENVVVVEQATFSLENTGGFFKDLYGSYVFRGEEVEIDGGFLGIVNKITYTNNLFTIQAKEISQKLDVRVSSEKYADSDYIKRRIYGRNNGVICPFNSTDYDTNEYPDGKDQIFGALNFYSGKRRVDGVNGTSNFYNQLRQGDVIKIFQNGIATGDEFEVDIVVDDFTLYINESPDADITIPNSSPSDTWTIEVERESSRIYTDRVYNVSGDELTEHTGDFSAATVSNNDTTKISAAEFPITYSGNTDLTFILKYGKVGDIIKITDSDGSSNPKWAKINQITEDVPSAGEATIQIGYLFNETADLSTTDKWFFFPINKVYVDNVEIKRNKFTVDNSSSGCKITLEDDFQKDPDVSPWKSSPIPERVSSPKIGMLMAGKGPRFDIEFDDAQATYNAKDAHGKTIKLPVYSTNQWETPIKVVIVNDYYDDGGMTLTPSSYFEDEFDADKDIEINISGGSSASATLATEDLIDLIKDGIYEKYGDQYLTVAINPNLRGLRVNCLFPCEMFNLNMLVGSTVADSNEINLSTTNIPDLTVSILDVGKNPREDSDFTKKVKVGDFIEYDFNNEYFYPGNADGAVSGFKEILALSKHILYIEMTSSTDSSTSQLHHYQANVLTEDSVVSVDCIGKKRISNNIISGTEPSDNIPIIKPKEIIEELMKEAGLTNLLTDQSPFYDSTSFDAYDDWITGTTNGNWRTYGNECSLLIPEKYDDNEEDLPEIKDIIKELNKQHDFYLVKPNPDANNIGFVDTETTSTSNEGKKFGIDFISTDGQHTTISTSPVYSWMVKEIRDHHIFKAQIKEEDKNMCSQVDYQYDYREDTDTWKTGTVVSSYAQDILGIEKIKEIDIDTGDADNALSIANRILKINEKPTLIFMITAWADADFEPGMLLKIYAQDLPNHHTEDFWQGIITKKTKKGDEIVYEVTDWGGILNE